MSLTNAVVCADCGVKQVFRMTGALVIEMFGKPTSPYKVWKADLSTCPGCGRSSLEGFGDREMLEHGRSGFKEILDELIEEYSPYVFYVFEKPGDKNDYHTTES